VKQYKPRLKQLLDSGSTPFQKASAVKADVLTRYKGVQLHIPDSADISKQDAAKCLPANWGIKKDDFAKRWQVYQKGVDNVITKSYAWGEWTFKGSLLRCLKFVWRHQLAVDGYEPIHCPLGIFGQRAGDPGTDQETLLAALADARTL
jgi:hypothetical protein